MDQELRKHIWPIFVAEAKEHLQQLGECLLSLEKPPGQRPPGQLSLLLRAAHSLKGSAGSLGFSAIEQLAHALEGSLQGNPPEPRLDPAQVQRSLRALEAMDQALQGLERGDGEGDVPDLSALLASMGSSERPAAKPTASTERQESAGADLFFDLWPVFRSEVLDNINALSEASRNWQGAPEGAEKKALQELATSLQQSGASLGFKSLEQLGEEAHKLLSGRLSAGTGKKLAQLATELERVAAEADERVEQSAPRAEEIHAHIPAPESAVLAFREESARALDQMEQEMSGLISPDERLRNAAAENIRQLTHALKGSAASVSTRVLADLGDQMHQAAKALTGPDAATATGTLAGLLVDFRAALAAAEAEPVPAASPAPAQAAPAQVVTKEGTTDSVIRVSRNAVEALASEVDSFALARARRERRVKLLHDLREQAHAVLLSTEHAASELRALELKAPLATLSKARDDVRALAQELSQLATAVAREAESERIFATQLKDTLRELRTVPASALLELLRRTVRETAGRLGKNVELVLNGAEVRLDRGILDAVRDPLLHLVRNAVDHGIEPPQTRAQAGKSPTGTVTVDFELRGARIGLTVKDDGAGLDLKLIRERAVSRGLMGAQSAEALSDAEVAKLIFHPGFSTADQVTHVSGRGVGLDVVESAAQQLGGGVEVHFAVGRGTTFALDLPQAIGAMLGIVVRTGDLQLALPNDSVMRLLRLVRRNLTMLGGQPVANIDDQPVPFALLSRVLGLSSGALPLDGDRAVETVVVSAGGMKAALAVDEVGTQQELVVHSLGRHLRQAPHLAGAALLDDGTVVPVLQPAEMLRRLEQQHTPSGKGIGKTRILVVDDALTTRAAMRSLLEIAGFEVLCAADGEEAWQLLAHERVSLVVTDVQMPRLDGLSLTRRLRSHPELSSVPVIIVTSVDGDEEKAQGLDAGADAYLVKRELERGALLERVRQLLPGDA